MVKTIKSIQLESTYDIAFPSATLQPINVPKVLGVAIENIFISCIGYGSFSESDVQKIYEPIKILQEYLRILKGSYITYDYLPVYTDNEILDDNNYYDYIIKKLQQHLFKYLPTFRKTLDLVTQVISANRVLKIDTKKDGANKDTKTYDNIIDGSSDTDSMNENSPINATLGDIVTPNNKNKARFGSTTAKTGTDTIDYTIDESIDDTHTETSPEYFKEIMKIYEKYNIYDIIHMCYRKVINEFNTSL